jgi:hypothetical protein
MRLDSSRARHKRGPALRSPEERIAPRRGKIETFSLKTKAPTPQEVPANVSCVREDWKLLEARGRYLE